jgi:steroid 5-alpha reductase family enzyme
MAELFTLLAQNLGVVVVGMIALWAVSVAIHNASIVDIAWGLLFVVFAWRTAYALDFPAHGVVVAALTTAWGGRLALYLARRNLGHGEDVRYQGLRKKHVPFWWKSLPIVFLLQAGLAFVVALPVQLAQLPRGESIVADVVFVVGVVVVVVGLAVEVVADLQLAQHRKRRAPGEKTVMTTGLWRYSRHPNYFGEAVVWWGFAVMSVSTALSATLSTSTTLSTSLVAYAGVVGAALITWLLLRLSGVPMLEAVMRDRPGYAEYVARTSAFFPRAPRP